MPTPHTAPRYILPPGITVRPTLLPEDDAFLFALYRETHRGEVARLLGSGHVSIVSAAAVLPEPLLRMQYTIRRNSYRQRFPDLLEELVLENGSPIGCLQTASAENEIRLVDIALLPDYHHRGIGTALIRGVQNKAGQQGIPVCLSVARDNATARRLYERLAFTIENKSTDGIYEEMIWHTAQVTAVP
jgi:ribosomal protein S18 acetylase RimI-like enzyme